MVHHHDDGAAASGFFAGVSAMMMLMIGGLVALALILGVLWQPWNTSNGESGGGGEGEGSSGEPASFYLDLTPGEITPWETAA